MLEFSAQEDGSKAAFSFGLSDWFPSGTAALISLLQCLISILQHKQIGLHTWAEEVYIESQKDRKEQVF